MERGAKYLNPGAWASGLLTLWAGKWYLWRASHVRDHRGGLREDPEVKFIGPDAPNWVVAQRVPAFMLYFYILSQSCQIEH